MTFTGTLFPYQPYAVDKMVDRKKLLVAYDMGLGKTPITIAAIEQGMDDGTITEPGIVVCLASLKYQWADAIYQFTEGTSGCIVIDGSPARRAEQYAEAYDWFNTGIDYVIMNYETVVNDMEFIKKLPRGFMVLDEATAIKSFRSKRSRAIKSLRKKAKVRYALTGTPIENGKPEELFSIMQFVDEDVFGPFPLFDKTFIVRAPWGGVERYRNLPTLHHRLKEASVRKSQTDADVAPFLPETIYNPPIKVKLDIKAQKLYRIIAKELAEDLLSARPDYGTEFDLMAHYGESLEGFQNNQAQGDLMSKIVCLRMLCDHPELLKISAAKSNDIMSLEGSAYAASLDERGLLDGLKYTPKLDKLVAYVKDFLDSDERNKVVIFSVFVPTLELIAEKLGAKQCLTYSGLLDSKEKNTRKDKFNNDPTKRVFISSDAGGYGVDLPAANMLINYDLPWSSGAATQRNGRIRRASSKWASVVIQDFIVHDSIEERQWAALQQKSSIADAIVDGIGIDESGGVPLTLGSLSKFLQEADL